MVTYEIKVWIGDLDGLSFRSTTRKVVKAYNTVRSLDVMPNTHRVTIKRDSDEISRTILKKDFDIYLTKMRMK
jgi:hypothetical protein